jgi:hypothetical protein
MDGVFAFTCRAVIHQRSAFFSYPPSKTGMDGPSFGGLKNRIVSDRSLWPGGCGWEVYEEA